MIPYLLAAVGGYLLGDSMKDSQTFADGGMMANGGETKSFDDLLTKFKMTKNQIDESDWFNTAFDIAYDNSNILDEEDRREEARELAYKLLELSSNQTD